MSNRIILGLDISTTCTGVSIVYVDEENKVKPLVVTHLRPKISNKIKGMEALFLKCNLVMEKLENILLENQLLTKIDDTTTTKITDIVIEEPLLSSNNQNTVAVLLKYNGMVADRIYNLLHIVPEFISSYNARMYGVPSLMAIRKYNKKGDMYSSKKLLKAIKDNELVLFGAYPFDCAKKLILWNYISELFPGIQWVYNAKGELTTENFDASDSLICVLGYINKLLYDGTEPEIVDSGVEGNVITYTYTFCGEKFAKTITIE